MPCEPAPILAFDTSAAQCAAALLRGGRVLARRIEAMDRGQAERLLPMLQATLAEAGVDWAELGALAVCTGPGNFTGCRIGVAAARGLAFGLGVPARGVTLFEALAEPHGRPVLACFADRKGRFVQLWTGGAALGPPVAEPSCLPPVPPDTLCVGAGAREVAAALKLAAGPETAAADPAALARAAARRRGTQPPPAPLYLRPADAMPASEPLPALLDDA